MFFQFFCSKDFFLKVEYIIRNEKIRCYRNVVSSVIENLECHYVRVKVKFALEQAMNAQMENRGTRWFKYDRD